MAGFFQLNTFVPFFFFFHFPLEPAMIHLVIAAAVSFVAIAVNNYLKAFKPPVCPPVVPPVEVPPVVDPVEEPIPVDPCVKIQFILKHREAPYDGEKEAEGQYSNGLLHSGLFNSANFMNNMLTSAGYQSEIVHVIDNSFIDREVTRFRPNIVIIEAFWVVPEKFDVLIKLHKNVKFVIRNHSKTPFLANEGIAFDWIMRYSNTPNVYISSNSLDTNEEVTALLASMHRDWTPEQTDDRCPFLPNYYPMEFHPEKYDQRLKEPGVLNVGCFGAIRPLKNQMIQAIAAIKFADKNGLKLKFHINGNRIEGNGNQVLKNLRNLFSHLEHDLVEAAWMPHSKFLDYVATMDMGMQVSYTETFNIVAADMISQGVPVVTSKEIDWVDSKFYADPNSCDDIVRVMQDIYDADDVPACEYLNATLKNIIKYDETTFRAWQLMIERLK
jgi:hypothetical protein